MSSGVPLMSSPVYQEDNEMLDAEQNVNEETQSEGHCLGHRLRQFLYS